MGPSSLLARTRAKLDRVWAIGKGSTYLRLYPNFGIGIGLGKNYRMAISVKGGFQILQATAVKGIWRIIFRIPKPKGRG